MSENLGLRVGGLGSQEKLGSSMGERRFLGCSEYSLIAPIRGILDDGQIALKLTVNEKRTKFNDFLFSREEATV